MNKILVLGDGLLGAEIVKQLGCDYLSRKKDNFDITSSFLYSKIIGYDVVINCIAHTDTYSETKDLHWNINYKSVYDLVVFCNDHNIKIVHIGTDFLYANNTKHEPTEEDVPVHAENWYSYTKLLGDGIVQLLSQDYLICRCSHKPWPFPFNTAYTDRISNVDYVSNIASIIINLVHQNANGIFNVGTDAKSMYDLAKISNPQVKPALTPDGLPSNTCMSISKLKRMNNYTLLESCPITGSTEKITYFDLGDFPLVNNLCNTKEESIDCEKYPLRVNFYPESTLSALSHAVNGDILFKNYLYKSEVNVPYYHHCHTMFDYVNTVVDVNKGDLIVDIGGNDGTLLYAFKEKEKETLEYLNIDPSENLASVCEEKGIPVLTDFFTLEVAQKLNRKAKVITSTNVFQHLKDTNSFADGVHHLMDDDSIWLLEFPYWIHDLETNQFDQIYHEHIYYYSITALNTMMNNHNLKIVRTEKQKIHGGTMRLVMAKNTSPILSDGSVETYLNYEKQFDKDYYKSWGLKISNHLEESKNLINKLKAEGKRIAAFGAAAKGCIFLNAAGINDEQIDFIIDDTDLKQNKFMPGTGLKIVHRDILKTEKIDYLLILTHNFVDYIVESLEGQYDGKFIVCLPEISIL